MDLPESLSKGYLCCAGRFAYACAAKTREQYTELSAYRLSFSGVYVHSVHGYFRDNFLFFNFLFYRSLETKQKAQQSVSKRAGRVVSRRGTQRSRFYKNTYTFKTLRKQLKWKNGA